MKRPPPRISVVIPARNEAALIASTVGSVLRASDRYRETRRDGAAVEVIVVNNASDDGTLDVLARQTAEGSVLMATCAPRGAARARNVGARLASGRALVFLDADTRLPPGALVRIGKLVDEQGYEAGITRLGAGWRPAGPLLVGLLERRTAAPFAAGQGDAGLHVLHPGGLRRVRAVRRARRHRRGVADPGRALSRPAAPIRL